MQFLTATSVRQSCASFGLQWHRDVLWTTACTEIDKDTDKQEINVQFDKSVKNLIHNNIFLDYTLF